MSNYEIESVKTSVSISDSQNIISPGAETPDRLRVGTLQYTKAGLITLFFWLLWGDFCFSLMELVIPSVLPLKLQSLDAPNWLLGMMLSTIPCAVNFMINPIISLRSDRYRSRWGRRIPFLFFATPFVTLLLISMGYSEAIGKLLHTLLINWFPTLTFKSTILVLLAILMVCFQFFNMFIASVYYYLFNDVVPRAYVARCMSLFRIVGVAAGSLYNWFVYRYAQTHMPEIFLGAGLLYLVGFMLMCYKVKEGKYPPPPENIGGKKGIFAAGKTYFQECFTHRFYWYYFLANAFWQVSGCIAIFAVFRSLSLGLTLNQLGKIDSVAMLITMLLLYPAGILSDRIHPLRVLIISLVIITLVQPVGFIYLFVDFSPQVVLWITIGLNFILIPAGTLNAAAATPLYMAILPKERYGQFRSADAMIRSISTIIFGTLAGFFMDALKNLYHNDPFYYRYIPCWAFLFQIVGMTFFLLLYREWKALGGRDHYVPPNTGVDERLPHGLT
ncbi:MAG: MFS transporter [Phycisphaerae bacterium]